MRGLEYLLEITKISQQEIADKLGIKKQNVSNWIRSGRNVPEKHASVLEEIFKINPIYFDKELDEKDKIEIKRMILNKNKEIANYIKEDELELSIDEVKLNIIKSMGSMDKNKGHLIKLTNMFIEAMKITNIPVDKLEKILEVIKNVNGLKAFKSEDKFSNEFYSLLKRDIIREDDSEEFSLILNLKKYLNYSTSNSVQKDLLKNEILEIEYIKIKDKIEDHLLEVFQSKNDNILSLYANLDKLIYNNINNEIMLHSVISTLSDLNGQEKDKTLNCVNPSLVKELKEVLSKYL